MTTSTNNFLQPILEQDPQWTMNGKKYLAYTVNGATLLRADSDAWYEFCPGIDHDRCFRCGGSEIIRIAGSEFRMKETIRRRIKFENSTMTFAKKAELKKQAAIDEWSFAHPDLAYLLAVVRSGGDRNEAAPSALVSLALRATHMPLNAAQERYVVGLLLDRALAEAFDTPQRSFVGNVGDVATFTGKATYVATLPCRYSDETPNVLVVLETSDGAVLKMNTRAGWAQRCVVGEEITVNAVVGGHVEHKHYGRQTVLNAPRRVWS
jgi:hypothetical protein